MIIPCASKTSTQEDEIQTLGGDTACLFLDEFIDVLRTRSFENWDMLRFLSRRRCCGCFSFCEIKPFLLILLQQPLLFWFLSLSSTCSISTLSSASKLLLEAEDDLDNNSGVITFICFSFCFCFCFCWCCWRSLFVLVASVILSDSFAIAFQHFEISDICFADSFKIADSNGQSPCFVADCS